MLHVGIDLVHLKGTNMQNTSEEDKNTSLKLNIKGPLTPKNGATSPLSPPSPTLSHLTQDEIFILKDVFRRQVEVQQEEKQFIRCLQRELAQYEHRVKQQAANTSVLRQADLRLCRLCFKTRFTNGIGRACYACQRRVCNKCGACSNPRYDPKKKKVRKGKWRCNLCNLKREIVCKSGIWFYGRDSKKVLENRSFRRKLISSSDTELENLDGLLSDNDSLSESDDEYSSVKGSAFDMQGGRSRSDKKLTRRHTHDVINTQHLTDDDISSDHRERKRRNGIDNRYRYKQNEERHETAKERLDRLSKINPPEYQMLQNFMAEDYCQRDQLEFKMSVYSPSYADSNKCFDFDEYDDNDYSCDEAIRRSLVEQYGLPESDSTPYYPLSVSPRQHRVDPRDQERYELERGSHDAPRRHSARPPVIESTQPQPYPTRRRASSPSAYSSATLDTRSTSDFFDIQRDRRRNSSLSPRHPPVDHRGQLSRRQSEQSISERPLNDRSPRPYSKEDARSRSRARRVSKVEIPEAHEYYEKQSHKPRHTSSEKHYKTQHTHADEKREDYKTATWSKSRSTSLEKENDKEPLVKSSKRERRYSDTRQMDLHSYNRDHDSRRPSHTRIDDSPTRSRRRRQSCTRQDSFSGSDSAKHRDDRHRRFDDRSRYGNVTDHMEPTLDNKRNPLVRQGSLGSIDSQRRYRSNASSINTDITDTSEATESSSLYSSSRRQSKDYAHPFGIGQEHQIQSIHSYTHAENNKRVKGQREIKLHRDCTDTSAKTAGLGLRVVGGKQMSDGSYRACVVYVAPGSEADRYGIRTGDQILEWNGLSLTNMTFEEARQIMDRSTDTVHLKIVDKEYCNNFPARPTILTDTVKEFLPEGDKSPRIILQRTTSVSMEELNMIHTRRRRMLPKTPAEMKKRNKTVTGKMQVKLNYDKLSSRLVVHVLQAEGLLLRKTDKDTIPPNPYVKIYLLPNRMENQNFRTNTIYGSDTPTWDSSYVFTKMSESQLAEKSLELTVWDYHSNKLDTFLGEVLLDLHMASLNNQNIWYMLEDHDENSAALPTPSPKNSLIDTIRGQDVMYLEKKAGGSPQGSDDLSGSMPLLPAMPAHEKAREWLGRKQSGGEQGRKNSDQGDSTGGLLASSSLSGSDGAIKKLSTSLSDHIGIKRKVSSAVTSAVGRMSRKQRSSSESRERSKSYDHSGDNDERRDSGGRNRHTSAEPSAYDGTDLRHSRGSDRLSNDFELLIPPHDRSRNSSYTNSFTSSMLTEDEDIDSAFGAHRDPERHPPEGIDSHFMAGRGQVIPKVPIEPEICKGELKLGFIITKGKLEVDVICAKGIVPYQPGHLPDTYVKIYLMQGNKRIKKRKTKVVKTDNYHIYNEKLHLSACNVHGRHIQASVWAKGGCLDKKQCKGEVVVKLDSIDLGTLTVSWYRIFPKGLVEVGSTESINMFR
ncbi:unnamed protein product [Owenia fusiformis]|uniref:Uncharacterized protein n=1 Tax=Owenia fusiformis TaxID=6347 RepID=A0A8J1TPC9_OWEFU|nr:unnamed protein product [Owenia fusiformis]